LDPAPFVGTIGGVSSVFERVVVPLEFVVADRDQTGAIEAGGYRLEIHDAVRRSIALGAKLAGTSGTLLLVHATPSLANASVYAAPEGTWMPQDSIRELDERATRAATKVLEDLGAKLCEGVKIKVHAAAGTPVDVILDEAKDFKADVIVLATSGRGRAKRFFLGSTADKVIRQAECPVMIVPEHD
jgi:nucleotide-binding universal stress UspA family protein